MTCVTMHCAGRSLILSSNGERTMRTCMDGCHALQPAELQASACELAATFVIVSGYSLYTEGLAQLVVKQATQVRFQIVPSA